MTHKFSSVLLALALVCPALIAQEKAEVVKFTARAPTAGEFQGTMVKTSNNSVVNMARDGEEMPERSMGAKAATSRDATILEAKDGVITKVRLHWREVTREQDMGGMEGGRRRGRGNREGAEPRTEVTELAGKTLILDLSGATPVVMDEEGAAAAEGLTRLVTRMETHENKFSGWSPDILGVLGKKEFTVGETIALKREDGAKLFGNMGGGMRMRAGRRGGRGGGRGGQRAPEPENEGNYSGNLVFKGKRTILGHDCGLFEVNVTDSADSSNERMQRTSQTTMTGELLVGIENGWLYKLEFKGNTSSDTSISMEERSMETSMQGTMNVMRQAIFAKKKAKPAN